MSSDVPAANAPPADVAMTPQAMLNDAEVAATRVRGNRVPEGSNLTVVEKRSFQDLLQEWCDARPTTIGHTQVLTEELRKGFFTKVFTNWDSDESCVPLPSMAPRTLQKSSFHAGYLKDNLPITPQKRKRGVTVQDNPKRMALQPAYLTVEFSSESEGKEFRFVWRDEKGTRVPVDYVKYREDVTKAQAIQSAIEAWDRDLRNRVEEYNTKLIIALARMRIVRFAEAGTDEPPYIPEHLRVNGRIMPCKLISDEFAEYFNVMKEVYEGLGNSQVGAPSHMM